jgi:AraC-like DNA-binding protein
MQSPVRHSQFDMSVLLRPERWVWVCPGVKTGARVVRHAAHERWMLSHTHAHPYREAMLVLAGTHFYGVEGRLYVAAPGTVFLFDRGVKHDSWYSRWQPDCRDLWLRLGIEHCAGAGEVLCRGGRLVGDEGRRGGVGPWYEPLHGPVVDALQQCWDEFAAAGESQPAHWPRLKAAATTMVLTMAMRRRDSVADRRIRDEQAGEVVEHVRNYVREHLHDELRLTTLAQLAGYAPFYFHRLFRRFSGMTLHAYVRYARVERARQLLREGHAVQDVAEQVGFRSAGSFSRFFHEMAGAAPAPWAKSEARFARREKQ